MWRTNLKGTKPRGLLDSSTARVDSTSELSYALVQAMGGRMQSLSTEVAELRAAIEVMRGRMQMLEADRDRRILALVAERFSLATTSMASASEDLERTAADTLRFLKALNAELRADLERGL